MSAIACGDADGDVTDDGGGGSGAGATSGSGGDGGSSTTSSGDGGADGQGGSGGSGGGMVSPPTLDAQMIGAPDWEPVDFHLFSVNMGNQFENFGMIAVGLLPPPAHDVHPDIGIGPGAAHMGPYDGEFAAGVAANGYVPKSQFAQREGLLPNAVMAVFMVVPSAGAPMGSSPDFTAGPIIPNGAFPIVVTVDAYQDDVLLDGYSYGFEVPPLDDTLDPPFDVDGHSHFPMFDAVYFDGMNMLPGTIETRINMVDANGEGWDLSYTATALP